MDVVAKLFGVFLACLVGPVLLAWGLYEAARHLLMGAYWLISQYGLYMVGTALLVLLACWGRHGFMTWLEVRQVRVQTAQALQRANAAYQQSRVQMQQLAQQYHRQKGIGQ
jgi:hypothetical protein